VRFGAWRLAASASKTAAGCCRGRHGSPADHPDRERPPIFRAAMPLESRYQSRAGCRSSRPGTCSTLDQNRRRPLDQARRTTPAGRWTRQGPPAVTARLGRDRNLAANADDRVHDPRMIGSFPAAQLDERADQLDDQGP